MRSIPSRLSRSLFAEPPASDAARTLYFRGLEGFVVGMTVWFAWTWALRIGAMTEMTAPVGLGAYVDLSGLLGTPYPLGLAAVATILALVGFARRGRFAYLTLVGVMHVLFVTRFSLGKIQHGSMLLGMLLLAFALATAFVSDEDERRRFTFGFSYFYVGLSYLLAGICKLIGTGITWPDGLHLWLWIHEKGVDNLAKFGATDLNLLQDLALSNHGIATILLVGGLVTELGGGLMWSRRLRPFAGVAFVSMHVGIYFIMNILFYVNIAIVVLLAFPWAQWATWLGVGRARPAGAVSAPST